MYLSTQNIISPYQHDFVQRRSVVTNLAELVQHLLGDVDNRGQVDVIYSDCSTITNDRLNNLILLQKVTSVLIFLLYC